MKSWKLYLSILASTTLFTSINATAACLNPAQFNCYHQPGYAVQISTSSLGVARYTDMHAYTFGFEISPYTRITGGSNTNMIGADIFARKNFPVSDQLVAGGGLILSKEFGRDNGQTIKNSYGVAPYAVLEYAATRQVLLSASVQIVNYQTKKLGNTTTRSWHVLNGGSLQFTYLFA